MLQLVQYITPGYLYLYCVPFSDLPVKYGARGP